MHAAFEQPRPVADRDSADHRWQTVNRALKRSGYQQDALIEVLHTAQEAFGHLPDPVLIHVAQQLRLPQSWVYGVASFYHFFTFKEPSAHTCIVCTGTACYVEGARAIVSAIENELGITLGETTADGRLSLVDFRCPGSCGLAPIVVLDGEMLGRETAETVLARLRALLAVNAVEEDGA